MINLCTLSEQVTSLKLPGRNMVMQKHWCLWKTINKDNNEQLLLEITLYLRPNKSLELPKCSWIAHVAPTCGLTCFLHLLCGRALFQMERVSTKSVACSCRPISPSSYTLSEQAHLTGLTSIHSTSSGAEGPGSSLHEGLSAELQTELFCPTDT